MNRYIDCTENLVEVFLGVVEKRYPSYADLKVKLLFDTKKRVRNGTLVLASIETANDKIKFFSKDDIAVEGYDYIIIVDLKAWEIANLADKERLISHELQHVEIDDKGTPKLGGHDIEDFYSEVENNKDNPTWKRDLATIAVALYDQEKEMAKTPKPTKNKGF